MKNALKNGIEAYLEDEKHFRDYEIKPLKESKNMLSLPPRTLCFQLTKKDSLENQIDAAVNMFLDNGYSSIVFYI